MPLSASLPCKRLMRCSRTRPLAAYDDNRRRNLLDDPLQTAQEIWQTYTHNILAP